MDQKFRFILLRYMDLKLYTNKIQEIGIVQQNEKKKYFIIEKRIEYKDEESGTEYIAIPDEEYKIETEIDYNSTALGAQKAKLNTISDFKNEISSSRTF